MLNKLFEKIFLVNLERRKDRYDEFISNASKYNLEFERFNAIDGNKTINDEFIYENKKFTYTNNEFYKNNPSSVNGIDNYHQKYFKGAIGCLLSHLEILKIAENNKYSSILILEDDVGFAENFQQKIEKLSNNFPKEWDMFYLSGSLIKEGKQFENYSELLSSHTTHSYAVNSSAYKTLIKLLIKNIYTKPVDSCYVSIQPSLKCFIAKPFVTYQLHGFSDIHNSKVDYQSIKNNL